MVFSSFVCPGHGLFGRDRYRMQRIFIIFVIVQYCAAFSLKIPTFHQPLSSKLALKYSKHIPPHIRCLKERFSPTCLQERVPADAVSWIRELKSFQSPSELRNLKSPDTIGRVSSTLQTLLIQGLQSGTFDNESVDFLISLLTQANAPFDLSLLGDGPWQAVRVVSDAARRCE